MAQLVIDVGNSFTKVAVFEGNEIVKTDQQRQIDYEWLEGFFTGYAIEQAIISSVKGQQEWSSSLKSKVSTKYFDRPMAFNISNHYRTPQTLGLDRLAAITGARYLYPQSDNMVIDAGTCVTYDSVDAAGNYYGGSISPGLNMRYQALHDYTAALPLIHADTEFRATYGDDTQRAIQSGVQNGIVYEALGFIQTHCKQAEKPCIILTGGGSEFLDSALKNSIFAGYIKTEPYLVLKGLNAAIQEHND